MYKKILFLIVTLILTACQTTQTPSVSTGNTSSSSGAGFDKTKAARNRVNNGLTYLSRNNLERAKFHLDKAISFDPDLGDVHYAFGLYYQKVHEYDKANRHFREALSTDSDNPSYLNAYGAFLCERKDYKDANKYFNRAIKVPNYTNVSLAYYNIGFCAVKRKDMATAEDNFRKALNRNPNMSQALYEMAQIAYAKGNFSLAQSYVMRFEKNSSITSQSAWLGLRIAHYLRDKDEIGRYGIILTQRFPDSEETAIYLSDKKRWM
ncbi:MAG: type IV pilus biogenesis/stability protein PilW [Gammaproteobacteria bacterium]|nr:type IV pilus biogenesis/stability protein PilW [Gammaproteobacteria bacterium]MDH5629436.1 type IV pilus biogenesis/stability protein PilW [Gammaproteobacteria bacterium]